MMARLTIDDSEVKKMFDNLEEMPKSVMKDAYPFLVNKTPVRSGNARNQTKLNGTTINSNYGYADRLNTGWSSQAPKGFTAPTEKQIDKEITAYIKKSL